MSDIYRDARHGDRKLARARMGRMGFADGGRPGMIIPTEKESQTLGMRPDVDRRGDVLRKLKGKVPDALAPNTSVPQWNEIVESSAQDMDRKPYVMGSGDKP